jgi:hypothetical protein
MVFQPEGGQKSDCAAHQTVQNGTAARDYPLRGGAAAIQDREPLLGHRIATHARPGLDWHLLGHFRHDGRDGGSRNWRLTLSPGGPANEVGDVRENLRQLAGLVQLV